MQSLLVMSFDEVLRSNSRAFELAEKSIQLFKRLYPEALVDYYDLLQENFSPDTRARFDQAGCVLFVVSFRDVSVVSDRLKTIFASIKKHELQLRVPYVFLLMPDSSQHWTELTDLVFVTFACPARVITKVASLAEEFPSL